MHAWLQAGLFGMDINKKGSREGEKKVPESLGLASGVVFLVRLGCSAGRCCSMLLAAAALAMLHHRFSVSGPVSTVP